VTKVGATNMARTFLHVFDDKVRYVSPLVGLVASIYDNDDCEIVARITSPKALSGSYEVEIVEIALPGEICFEGADLVKEYNNLIEGLKEFMLQNYEMSGTCDDRAYDAYKESLACYTKAEG